jgi:DNA-binding beta-propeller fold protein YncE
MANHTLSIIDIDLLAEGGTRADALVDTIDLSEHAPGPLSLAITPDGKTALVSISVGFLNLIGAAIPTGEDKLLIVDIESRTVTGEIAIGAGPMGIAITHDSKTAFVGLLGQTAFAVVDIESQTFETVDTGATYNEELAIDDSGEVAILSYGVAGDVKTFAVDDPAGTLGGTSGITGDGAGVAFFPGTKIAYLVQAPTPLTGNVGGHDLVDVTDPSAPVASDNVRIEMAPTSYPVTTVHARNSVAYPAITGGRLTVVEMKLEDGVATEVQAVDVGPSGLFAYGIGATSDGRVLIAEPGTHTVSVVDLETGTGFSVPWEVDAYGPTEIKVIP